MVECPCLNELMLRGSFFEHNPSVMVATEAAGEGINLQFCSLMVNYDIPWNPNRLEQRMGRIHRYKQQKEVMIFNLVAANTREGQVMQRLLIKHWSCLPGRVIADVGVEAKIGPGARSHLCNVIKRVNEALTIPYEELKEHIPTKPVLNPGKNDKDFGDALLMRFKKLFRFWHQRDKIPKDQFDRRMLRIKKRVLILAEQDDLLAKSETLAKRLRKHGDDIFRFLNGYILPA